jgi:hypothetical protein
MPLNIEVNDDEDFTVKPGEDVSLRSRIGRGATAVVWHGRVSSKDVAIKQISLASFQGTSYCSCPANDPQRE